jgi:hypothetical protein
MTEQQQKHIKDTLLSHEAILTTEAQTLLDSTYDSIAEYLKANKEAIASDNVQADGMYAEFLKLSQIHGETKKATLYKFTLSLEEYKFIKSTLTRKLKYNRQDVLIAKRAKAQFLDVYEFLPTVTSAQAVETFMVDLEALTLVSYLIGKFEVEGFDKTAENFASVVEKMNNISAVHEYYDARFARILEDGQNWVAGIAPAAKPEAAASDK